MEESLVHVHNHLTEDMPKVFVYPQTINAIDDITSWHTNWRVASLVCVPLANFLIMAGCREKGRNTAVSLGNRV